LAGAAASTGSVNPKYQEISKSGTSASPHWTHLELLAPTFQPGCSYLCPPAQCRVRAALSLRVSTARRKRDGDDATQLGLARIPRSDSAFRQIAFRRPYSMGLPRQTRPRYHLGRWLLPYLSRITNEEFREGFVASGASAPVAEQFTRSIRERVSAFIRIANGRSFEEARAK
jgi:hypothetical protein